MMYNILKKKMMPSLSLSKSMGTHAHSSVLKSYQLSQVGGLKHSRLTKGTTFSPGPNEETTNTSMAVMTGLDMSSKYSMCVCQVINRQRTSDFSMASACSPLLDSAHSNCHPSVHPPTHPFINLSIQQPTYPSTHWPIYRKHSLE